MTSGRSTKPAATPHRVLHHVLALASLAGLLACGLAAAWPLGARAQGTDSGSLELVDPDVFLFIYTVTMVIMVVTGGKGTLAGPVVGGVIFGLMPEGLRAAAIKPEAQWIVYGVLMVLVVYFLPRGIVPALSRN